MKTLLFIGGIGMQEVLLIALVILLFFGGKKIPELSIGYVMFMIGVAVSYLLIFPLIFRFLGTFSGNTAVMQLIILVIAAVITPTSDIFTLLLVSLPMYMLYEISILISKQKK